jgi:hypothetical protein
VLFLSFVANSETIPLNDKEMASRTIQSYAFHLMQHPVLHLQNRALVTRHAENKENSQRASRKMQPPQTDPALLDLDSYMQSHRSEPSPENDYNQFDFLLLRGVANARIGMVKADPRTIDCKYGRKCFREGCRFAHRSGKNSSNE